MTAALATGEPLAVLAQASGLLAAITPAQGERMALGEAVAELPSREEFLDALLGIPTPETSALLTAFAALIGDDVLAARVRREVASRGDRLPPWLTQLGDARAVDRAVAMGHVLGDGENVMFGVVLADGSELTCACYVDHNMGTLVKDAFVNPQPLTGLLADFADQSDDDDVSVTDLALADARARITAAIELSAITFPPPETETWPACRPLVEWALRLLPDGGQGYVRPEWSDADRSALQERFLASPFAVALDRRARELVDPLLWFGCDYGPGDPLHWSPVVVEIVLADWFPRKVMDDAGTLARLPELLRAFIRFAHAERGISAPLTADTLAAVEEFEPEYRKAIGRPRLQGLDALIATVAALDPHGVGAHRRADLVAAVGGEKALERLDADPLPDEPFDWTRVPDAVRERVADVLPGVDRACTTFFDVELRTAARRLLAALAAGHSDVLARGRAHTTAAAVCWLAARVNGFFEQRIRWGDDPTSGGPSAAELMAFFGAGASTPSQRGKALATALGGRTTKSGQVVLGSPDFLVAHRRSGMVALRDALG